MALTDLKIRSAQSAAKPYRLTTDGYGFSWSSNRTGRNSGVGNTGSRANTDSWHSEGTQKSPWPRHVLSMRLPGARLHEGTDPMAGRRAEKSSELESRRKAKAEAEGDVVNPFRDVATQWFNKWKVGKVERYVLNTERRLNDDVLSRIGNRPIAEVRPPEIAKMILAIEERGAEDVARRALQTMQQIFRYAMAFGFAEQNPAMAFRPSDILKQRVTTNFARVDVSALPDLLKKIEFYDGSHFVRLALQLMALVFVRTGEMIPAKWSEFDRNEGIWNIPAARVKMRRPHLVPLSRQTLSVLDELWRRRKNDVWLFPGERTCPHMNKNSMLKAIERMGFKGQMTGHGFRGLASTILNEMGYERAYIEMQLSHAPQNEVESAYNKALYLAQRRDMMQDWADFLDQTRKSSGSNGTLTISRRRVRPLSAMR